MRALVLPWVLGLAVACSAPPDEPEEDAGTPEDAGPAQDAGSEPAAFRHQLDDADDLDDLRGATGLVLFLLQKDDVEPAAPILERCTFQNTSMYERHLFFIQAQPGGEEVSYDEYVANMLERQTRVWWGGTVAWLASTPHPITQEPGVLAYGFYTRDTLGNRLEADDIREVDAILKSCTPYYEGKLAFAPDTPEQRQTATVQRATLEAEGIAILLP